MFKPSLVKLHPASLALSSRPALALLGLSLLCAAALAACQPGGPSGPSPSPSASSGPSVSPSPAVSPGSSSPSPGVSPGSGSPSPGTTAEPGSGTPGSGTPGPVATIPANAAGIKIEAASRFLTFKGQTIQLSVVLLDAASQPISVSGRLPLEWTSSRPQDISVDALGKVTALLEDGYSVIGAKLTGTNFSNTLTLNITQESSGGGGGGGGGGGTPRPTPSASAQFVGGFN